MSLLYLGLFEDTFAFITNRYRVIHVAIISLILVYTEKVIPLGYSDWQVRTNEKIVILSGIYDKDKNLYARFHPRINIKGTIFAMNTKD